MVMQNPIFWEFLKEGSSEWNTDVVITSKYLKNVINKINDVLTSLMIYLHTPALYFYILNMGMTLSL